MTSNYKRIGDYIRLVDVRNKQLEVNVLLGLSISKEFIPSVANTVGTDMANYKIIRKGQFACSLMQVRRDKRIPVALQRDFDEAIISQAYPVFEVFDLESLDPEYLMMWMSRAEFDRHACFLAVGGVRGSLEWDDFCDMELPVPSIEKQREIVREYNVVNDYIALNEQQIQKLEDAAQAIYKHWFVDFEFPISKEYAESIGQKELIGMPYKSSGGEMIYNEESGHDIPIEWEIANFSAFRLDISDGNYSSKYPKNSEFINEGVPFIRGTDFNGNFIDPSNFRYISKEKHSQLLKGHTKSGDVLITTRGASIGKYAFIPDKYVGVNINSQLVRINGRDTYPQFYLGLVISSQKFKEELEGAITGSAQPQLSISNLLGIKLLKPPVPIIHKFCQLYNQIHTSYLAKFEERILLKNLKKIVSSRMSNTLT